MVPKMCIDLALLTSVGWRFVSKERSAELEFLEIYECLGVPSSKTSYV